MPCYDPPPPWDSDARSNAEQAVKLLCQVVKDRLRPILGTNLVSIDPDSIPLLEWYLDHRKIDLQMAQSGWFGSQMRQESDDDIARDIERTRAWIQHLRLSRVMDER